jgi:hypothetical protein
VLDKVNPLRFNDVAATVKTVVPKLMLLNQLPVVNVCTAVPEVNVRFNPLVAEPPTTPKSYVLATVASATIPPVPVQEKLVTSGPNKALVLTPA